MDLKSLVSLEAIMEPELSTGYFIELCFLLVKKKKKKKAQDNDYLVLAWSSTNSLALVT